MFQRIPNDFAVPTSFCAGLGAVCELAADASKNGRLGLSRRHPSSSRLPVTCPVSFWSWYPIFLGEFMDLGHILFCLELVLNFLGELSKNEWSTEDSRVRLQ